MKIFFFYASLLFLPYLFSQTIVFGEHKDFYQLQLKKFQENGGKLDDIINVKSKQQLISLVEDKGIPKVVNYKGKENRFNFILTQDKQLKVSRFTKSHPQSISHSILPQGEAILAAGEMYIFHDSENVLVHVSNHSKKFCTPDSNMNLVLSSLEELHIPKLFIRYFPYPNKLCRRKK